jgi:colanic acid/amylovoran biosynthesis protein
VRRLDPAINVLDPWGSLAWNVDGALIDPTRPPSWFLDRVLGAAQRARRRAPTALGVLAAAALWSVGRRPRLVNDYLAAVRSADLVIVAGAGFLTDAFTRHALAVLETLRLAIASEAVTALMSQGVGPIADETLRDRVSAILPHVNVIALREAGGSLALLESIGVSPDRIIVTGDDAVALGYASRADRVGTAIGMNLRVAQYSGIDDVMAVAIGRVVREAAVIHHAALVGLPISRYGENDDLRIIDRLLEKTTPSDRTAGPSTPAEFLKILPACRVVVTGSYHAAVLALSMGIPAVTIAGSDYYEQKFRGVAGQFGSACRVLPISAMNFDELLRGAIAEAWRGAEAARAPLLAAAREQVQRSQTAYHRVFEAAEHTSKERADAPE